MPAKITMPSQVSSHVGAFDRFATFLLVALLQNTQTRSDLAIQH